MWFIQYFAVVVLFWNIGKVSAQCSAPACIPGKFQSLDGTCNNLQNPLYGAVNTGYAQFGPVTYHQNDYRKLRRSKSGQELPLPRLLSTKLFSEGATLDNIWTLMLSIWGQFIVHDMSLALSDEQPCCNSSGQITNSSSECISILIPKDDPTFSLSKIECIPFTRTAPDKCGTQGPEQRNSVTSFMDLSPLYGNSVLECSKIRSFVGGRLATIVINGQEFLTKRGCDFNIDKDKCFLTGDIRASENLPLFALQNAYVLYHNHVADGLKNVNPHWDDDRLFSETRRILIAENQIINYHQYLPIILGGIQAAAINIFPYYDPKINPSTIDEYTTAAMRYLHTTCVSKINFYDIFYSLTLPPSRRLREAVFNPIVLTTDDNLNKILRGTVKDPQEAVDNQYNTEIKNFLFGHFDLIAADIMRGRDHGLPSYNEVRKICGLPKATSMIGFLSQIGYSDILKLINAYGNIPDDVDLVVGASLEFHVPGTFFGPTFNCIIYKQFYNTARGDRYFYKSKDPVIKFTDAQLQELEKKSSVSHILCHGSSIGRVSKDAFLIPNSKNPIRPCTDFPPLDFSLWKE